MSECRGRVLRLIEEVNGFPIADETSFVRSDLHINGDDGWILFDNISKETGVSINNYAAKVFYTEMDMAVHRVLLRAIGLNRRTVTMDVRVNELIDAVCSQRIPQLERVDTL